MKLAEKMFSSLDRVKGRHQFGINKKEGKYAVVPMHNKDFPVGTLNAILKQAGIDKNEIK